jgi:hypothetical protein
VLAVAGIVAIIAGVVGLAAIAYDAEILEQFAGVLRHRLVALFILYGAPTVTLLGGILAVVPKSESAFMKVLLGPGKPALNTAIWMLASTLVWYFISVFVRSDIILPVTLLSASAGVLALYVWLEEFINWRDRRGS